MAAELQLQPVMKMSANSIRFDSIRFDSIFLSFDGSDWMLTAGADRRLFPAAFLASNPLQVRINPHIPIERETGFRMRPSSMESGRNCGRWIDRKVGGPGGRRVAMFPSDRDAIIYGEKSFFILKDKKSQKEIELIRNESDSLPDQRENEMETKESARSNCYYIYIFFFK